jgi:hypothetical protein
MVRQNVKRKMTWTCSFPGFVRVLSLDKRGRPQSKRYKPAFLEADYPSGTRAIQTALSYSLYAACQVPSDETCSRLLLAFELILTIPRQN